MHSGRWHHHCSKMGTPELLDFSGLLEYEARKMVLDYHNSGHHVRGDFVTTHALLDATLRGWPNVCLVLLNNGARADIRIDGRMALLSAALTADPDVNESLFRVFGSVAVSLDYVWNVVYLVDMDDGTFEISVIAPPELEEGERSNPDVYPEVIALLFLSISSPSTTIAQRAQYVKWLLAIIARPNFFENGKTYLSGMCSTFSYHYKKYLKGEAHAVWTAVMRAFLRAGSARYEQYIDTAAYGGESFYGMTLRANDISNVSVALTNGYQVRPGDLLWGVVHGSTELFNLLLRAGVDPVVSVQLLDVGDVMVDLSDLRVGQLNRLVRNMAARHVSSLQLQAGIVLAQENMDVSWLHPFQRYEAGLYNPDEDV